MHTFLHVLTRTYTLTHTHTHIHTHTHKHTQTYTHNTHRMPSFTTWTCEYRRVSWSWLWAR